MVVRRRPLDPVPLEQQQVERERARVCDASGSAPSPAPTRPAATSRAARRGTSACTSRRSRRPSRRPRAGCPRARSRSRPSGACRGRASTRRARRADAPRPWRSRRARQRPSEPALVIERLDQASFETALAPVGGHRRRRAAPWRRAISVIRRPKKPHWATITVSPGSSRLAIPASMPAVPVQWSGSTSAVGHPVHAPRAARRRPAGSRASSGRGGRASAVSWLRAPRGPRSWDPGRRAAARAGEAGGERRPSRQGAALRP